jgi:hypothetical protein
MRVELGELLTRSESFAGNTSLPPALRVAFGFWGLKIADFACLRPQLHTPFRAIAGVLDHPDVRAAHRSAANMVYHRSRGDIDTALGAAREMVCELRKRSHAADLSHGLRCAAHVARQRGYIDEMLRYLVESATVAEQHQLVTHAVRSCGRISEHYLYELELNEAKAWYRRAAEWNQRADDPTLATTTALCAAKIALINGNTVDATNAMAGIRVDAYGGHRPDEVDALAVRIHLRIAERDYTPAEELRTNFSRAFAQCSSYGDLDYAAFVRFLWESERDESGARAALRRYITEERRELGPVPRIIQIALGSG